MTKKLAELFNLDADEQANVDVDSEEVSEEKQEESTDIIETTESEMAQISDAIEISEKINNALQAVENIDTHDSEMDEIAKEAMKSYKDLMDLGMNVADMAAGQVLTNASQMLKIALEAKDAKVSRKLKQVDLMLKKARIDQLERKQSPADDDSNVDAGKPLDRNELLKLMIDNSKK